MGKVSRADCGVGAAIVVRVELFGTARIAAGCREIVIEVDAETDAGDVVAAIVAACPALVGGVIDEKGTRLLESHVLNVNGTAFVDGGRISLGPGDRLLLFSSQAGG